MNLSELKVIKPAKQKRLFGGGAGDTTKMTRCNCGGQTWTENDGWDAAM